MWGPNVEVAGAPHEPPPIPPSSSLASPPIETPDDSETHRTMTPSFPAPPSDSDTPDPTVPAPAVMPDPPTTPMVSTQPAFHRPTQAIIHLSHIQANLRAVQQKVGTARKVWAIVKANAYGHGMLRVADACLAAGAYGLGVATTDEAIRVRDRFHTSPILLLGPSLPADAEDLVANEIDVAVGDPVMARALSGAAARLEKHARAHLKVDTGMGRFGFAAEELSARASELAALPAIHWNGVFTHFAVSDSPAPEDVLYTSMQLRWLRRAMSDLVRHFPRGKDALPMLHACNSGGVLQHTEAYLDAVRPGIMLYGHLPDPLCKPTVPLLPGMTLKTRIVHLRTHTAGSSLSYGRTYECPRETRIGILPIGYGDGYHRHLSNRGEVVIDGRRAPIRGRVCMDQTLVDVTDIPGAGVGSEVILFGGQPGPDGRPPLPVQEVADWLKTITYEVTCHIGRRIPRIYED